MTHKSQPLARALVLVSVGWVVMVVFEHSIRSGFFLAVLGFVTGAATALAPAGRRYDFQK